MQDSSLKYIHTCCTELPDGDIFEELRRQELDSLRNGHYADAEEAKKRFQRLKEQQIRQRQEMLTYKNKENIKEVEKQAEHDISQFQREWETKLRIHIEQAKKHEETLQRQHDAELQEFTDRTLNEEPPKVKFSPHVLTLRRNLENLIKIRDYKEAEATRDNLQEAEDLETEQWRVRFEQKRKHKYEQIVRRQENEFKALRVKLETHFNEKIKEREVKFHILLKKNQKRKIEQAKLNQTNTLELSRDLSRTLSTLNRPLNNANRAVSKSTEKKAPTKAPRAWFN